MNIIRLTLGFAALTFGTALAQEFSETFSSGTIPAGWTADPSFSYGNRDFSNGRMNIHPTDAGQRLLRSLTVPSGATKVVLRYTGNTAPSGIGEASWVEVRTTTAQQYVVQHGYGDVEAATGTMASRVMHIDMNNPTNYSTPGYQQMPKIFDTFSYVVTFENGRITHQILRAGAVHFEQAATVPGFVIKEINQVGLALYTTIGASIWADDLSVSFILGGDTPFTDPFDMLDRNRWEIVGGSWSTVGGLLTASWDTGAAQTDQGNLLLTTQNLSADFDAYFRAVLGNGATGFALYASPGNKYNVNIGAGDVGVERRINGGNYSQVATAALSASTTIHSVMRLSRRGAVFSLFHNGTQVLEFTDVVWAGALRLGLRVYNVAGYDAFSLNEPLGLDQGGDCAILQQALNDALAALAQANAQIALLQTANAGLQRELATSESQVASLQDTLTAVSGSLLRVRNDFRAEFSDSTFELPGATPAAQVDEVADAIIGLNHGRKQAVYRALK